MRGFTLFWFGQLVSLLGTNMTRFALTIWAWEVTGQATALALVAVFSFGPAVLMSPIAGALVDRLPRKLMIILSDLAAGLVTLVVLALYTTGNLQIWHLYVAGAVAGAFESFQFPAFSAAISTMLPKAQYGRANGMLSLAESVSLIAAPVLAGLLLAVIGIDGIMLIDAVTFVFAIAVVLFIVIPPPQAATGDGASAGGLWSEIVFGFRYILARPSLLGLQLTFMLSNFFGGIGMVLLSPMVLARTGNSELALGSVQSAMGVGGVVGGALMSLWGGPKRRVHGVLLGLSATGAAQVWLGLGQTVWIWAAAGFCFVALIPILNGANQAIWQAKVAPGVQGRVFAARRMIAQIIGPVGMALAGPLADRLFEPAMHPGGSLAALLGAWFGTGPGAGMAVIMALAGVAAIGSGLAGYLAPAVRQADTLLPDHDAAAQP
jgi:MFS family permease